jgi:serine/threonine-protein kinase
MTSEFLIGDWEVRPFHNCLVREGHTVKIEPKAMQVLVFLAEHPEEVVRKESLMDAIWEGGHVTEDVLTNAIWEIRRALGDHPKNPLFIQTVPTKGYRLIAPVSAKGEPGTSRRKLMLSAVVIPAGVVVLGTLAALGMWTSWRSPSAARGLTTRVIAKLRGALQGPTLTFSPNGRDLVYAGYNGEVTQLYRRAIGSLDVTPIPGTEGAYSPFFSPDGEWVGFFKDGKLKKVALNGGFSLTLCECSGLGAAWGPNGNIVIGGETGQGLSVVSAEGGEPEVLTRVDSTRGEVAHAWPEFLPGGKALLFMISGGEGPGEGWIVVQSLETGDRHQLVKGSGYARYAPTGHLVYGRAGSLMAVPFDPERLTILGAPKAVLEGVSTVTERQSAAWFSFSQNGTLVYIPGDAQPQQTLVWVDRSGKSEPLAKSKRNYYSPRLSPDGKRLAVAVLQDSAFNIWLYDLAHPRSTRLTLKKCNIGPAWAPDGRVLAFASNREGPFNVFLHELNGGGPERVTASEFHQVPTSWSPDGRTLVFSERRPDTGWDSRMMTLESKDLYPLLDSPFEEEYATVSPNGKWLAFGCNDSGKREVYVKPVSNPGPILQMSREGGSEPVWSRSGAELFYRSGERSNRMMSVSIAYETPLLVSEPRFLFEGDYGLTVPLSHPNYDVTPDGQRFVMVKNHRPRTTELHVVLNWFGELEEGFRPQQPCLVPN